MKNKSQKTQARVVKRTKAIAVSKGMPLKTLLEYVKGFLHGFSIHADALKRVSGCKNASYFAKIDRRLLTFERKLDENETRKHKIVAERSLYIAGITPDVRKSRRVARAILDEKVMDDFEVSE